MKVIPGLYAILLIVLTFLVGAVTASKFGVIASIAIPFTFAALSAGVLFFVFRNGSDRQQSRKFNAEAKIFAAELQSRYAAEMIAKRSKEVRE